MPRSLPFLSGSGGSRSWSDFAKSSDVGRRGELRKGPQTWRHRHPLWTHVEATKRHPITRTLLPQWVLTFSLLSHFHKREYSKISPMINEINFFRDHISDLSDCFWYFHKTILYWEDKVIIICIYSSLVAVKDKEVHVLISPRIKIPFPIITLYFLSTCRLHSGSIPHTRFHEKCNLEWISHVGSECSRVPLRFFFHTDLREGENVARIPIRVMKWTRKTFFPIFSIFGSLHRCVRSFFDLARSPTSRFDFRLWLK